MLVLTMTVRLALLPSMDALSIFGISPQSVQKSKLKQRQDQESIHHLENNRIIQGIHFKLIDPMRARIFLNKSPFWAENHPKEI